MPRKKASGFTIEEARHRAIQKLEREASSRGETIKGSPKVIKAKPLMGGRLGYEVIVSAVFKRSGRR